MIVEEDDLRDAIANCTDSLVDSLARPAGILTPGLEGNNDFADDAETAGYCIGRDAWVAQRTGI
jgi:hypothetical protein